MSWVWIDGSVVPAADAERKATVPVDDMALLRGIGVFETFKVVAGVPFALRRHLIRLRDSARIAGIKLRWTDDQLVAACAELLAAIPSADSSRPLLRLRITVTGGSASAADGPREPSLLLTAEHGANWPVTAAVVTDEHPINERSPLAGAKVTSYLEQVVVLERARRRGADEAVRANTVGALCEGTGSNVFLVVDGDLCTPALTTGCLPGVTRALVCELVPVTERDDLTFDHLRRAPEAFLTSSTRDVHPIGSVDGIALHPTPGPLTAAAAAAFEELVATDLDP